jgi:hypothetical protein
MGERTGVNVQKSSLAREKFGMLVPGTPFFIECKSVRSGSRLARPESKLGPWLPSPVAP